MLGRHPGPFLERTAPWLKEQLEWDDADVAAAALTTFFPTLCPLDVRHAERCMGWLTGPEVGLTRKQAGRLLLADDWLLVGGTMRELGREQAAVAAVAKAASLPPSLVAALRLSQPGQSGFQFQHSVQLAGILLVSACWGCSALTTLLN